MGYRRFTLTAAECDAVLVSVLFEVGSPWNIHRWMPGIPRDVRSDCPGLAVVS